MQQHKWTKEELAARRKRSIAIALVLVALMVLFYITTIVRLGGNVADRTF
ncbi:MAG: hypothetical protein ACR2OM_08510 [Aestuariivirgaceae bacterium]